ncbi:MAG: hypothetical protein WBO10_09960 [Pyrinomonadaceae bacterium]
MRIQEMRSGISHLRKKIDASGQEIYVELASVGAALSRDEERIAAPACDLDEPLWSVVSFDQREAGGLTYAQAVHLMSELDAHNITGLCIITDTAAAKMT